MARCIDFHPVVVYIVAGSRLHVTFFGLRLPVSVAQRLCILGLKDIFFRLFLAFSFTRQRA
jgi:hypothetical protein